ncbi:uncharacterized protein LOC128205469 isoform X2 [Mya arenaria]|uniref:uncharacterized protein LOC128205469 isoform X2 n=1 Tax=Mya arenaria TaxID=6604 RepID=UPI0022E550EB|nr:uncharacterized protein LOC128205469 isoform X2 [Mya arenaria]
MDGITLPLRDEESIKNQGRMESDGPTSTFTAWKIPTPPPPPPLPLDKDEQNDVSSCSCDQQNFESQKDDIHVSASTSFSIPTPPPTPPIMKSASSANPSEQTLGTKNKIRNSSTAAVEDVSEARSSNDSPVGRTLRELAKSINLQSEEADYDPTTEVEEMRLSKQFHERIDHPLLRQYWWALTNGAEFEDEDYLSIIEMLEKEDTMDIHEYQRRYMKHFERRAIDRVADFDEDFEDFHELTLQLDMAVSGQSSSVLQQFSHGSAENIECLVCLETKTLHKRECCSFPVCDDCIGTYLETNIQDGMIKITCISDQCNVAMVKDEILARVSVPMKEKFNKFLVDANKDPKIKTCPKCSHVYHLKDEETVRQTKYGLPVMCREGNCKLTWCFVCHAPWHTGLKCRDFRKGNKMVKSWAREKHYGQTNAQRCPKCKIFIERKSGCDHMTCSQCRQDFCYRCGGRYLNLKFLGNHNSRYSPFGCKYIFKPNRPITRRLVRSSVLGAKLLGGVILAGLGVAAAGVLIGTSPITLPAFGAYKLHKRRQNAQRWIQQQRMFKLRSQNAIMEFHRERLARMEEHPSRRLSTRNDAVHIGIQTGASQQVDVTVNTPDAAGSEISSSEMLNSEIRMNITDERGHVTVTTAEISHNASGEEGSEAEIILHVKTSYPKEPKDKLQKSNSLKVTDTKDEKIAEETMKFNMVKENQADKSTDKSGTTKSPDDVNSGISPNEDFDTCITDCIKSDCENTGTTLENSCCSMFGTFKGNENKLRGSVSHRRSHSLGSIKKSTRIASIQGRNKRLVLENGGKVCPDHVSN